MATKLQVKSFASAHNFLNTLVAPGLKSFTKDFFGKTLVSASNAFLEEPSRKSTALSSWIVLLVAPKFKGCVDGMKPLKASTSPGAQLFDLSYPSDKEDPTDAFLAEVHPFVPRYHTTACVCTKSRRWLRYPPSTPPQQAHCLHPNQGRERGFKEDNDVITISSAPPGGIHPAEFAFGRQPSLVHPNPSGTTP
ncbi:hypothetical protein FRB90_000731 [Tulasnella sp. 427]|nr:hypothetical protein FRB90_000731 [Tulasnella sp. 427]